MKSRSDSSADAPPGEGPMRTITGVSSSVPIETGAVKSSVKIGSRSATSAAGTSG